MLSALTGSETGNNIATAAVTTYANANMLTRIENFSHREASQWQLLKLESLDQNTDA